MALEDSTGSALEVGAHACHESRVVAGSVAGDERCEERGGHVEGLDIFFDFGVSAVSEDIDEDHYYGKEDVVK